ESSGLVIIAPALKHKASTPAVASTLTTWLLEITPTAIPSPSHTTTRGVSRFARIRAASIIDASRLSTASRFRAASKMCLTRIISTVPHPPFVRGSLRWGPKRFAPCTWGRFACCKFHREPQSRSPIENIGQSCVEGLDDGVLGGRRVRDDERPRREA